MDTRTVLRIVIHALVFESALTGHRAYYVRLLCDELLRLGIEVTVAVPDVGEQMSEFEVHLGGIRNHVQWIFYATREGIHREADSFLSVINDSSWDHVFCTCSDILARQLGQPFAKIRRDPQRAIEGLLMRINAAYLAPSVGGRTKDLLAERLIARCPFDRFHFLDPLSWRRFFDNSGRAPDAKLMPEAIEPLAVAGRIDACQILGVPADTRYITCPGTVQERKGIRELVAAFRMANIPDTRLLLIGKQTATMSQYFKEYCGDLLQSEKLVLSDRYVSSAEFDCLFAIADLVCVPYPKHLGSASILIRASRAGCNIVASDWGWIGWASKQFDLARTCDVNDVETFADSLISSLQSGDDSIATSSIRKSFNQFHTRDNYLAHWTAFLGERHGLNTLPTIKFPASDSQV
ncbi:glycosyltransferase [Rubripirellula reticaptiva]|uniref:GDP-mannose-dependent alpha-(1-2)-phosphatidylinositol mannosyltransferase n=1 Tax=Rubripirellula reticaptiva TaxID=2528013 RepID=A0A5C6F4V8_9BACT|nr:glycosyltransferase [Rubripirellula reticaptiva]TWU55487.1 GDP-mannose-dependent alpha-(1-2)-phosphatidylinositol mannosyltransferase [Rubripirellula reticaptiva]